MEQAILSDKDLYPSEEIIFSHIGKSKPLWLSLLGHIHSYYPDFTEEWRYYNDGKSWLMKVQYKKKTVFWLSILEGSFRTSFYFPARVEKTILSSPISGSLKEQFKKGKDYGKIRGIRIIYKKKRDVEDAKSLIEMKLSIK
ncbi:MAG TPA: DUF3788 family protein [Ignavibacteriaceae bacterium]|nr:DUF3788 family protein [Ignavibacteriaceae bacterium]